MKQLTTALKIALVFNLFEVGYSLAGNLSTLINAGRGSSNQKLSTGNYYEVGGNPHFCIGNVINNSGQSFQGNLNEGKACDNGKICTNGACIAGTDPCEGGTAPLTGTLCGGGTVYAGEYNGSKYMVTPGNCAATTDNPLCDHGTDTLMKKWANNSGTTAFGVSTGATSSTNGATNTSTLANNYTDTDAAKYCHNLDYGGYTDWYLPGLSELVHLYNYKNLIRGFELTYYWSSTEFAVGNASTLHFTDASMTNPSKTTSYRIRCVRRF